MSFKKCKVVMLSTNQKTENTAVLNTTFNTNGYDKFYKFQHLYFINDDQI